MSFFPQRFFKRFALVLNKGSNAYGNTWGDWNNSDAWKDDPTNTSGPIYRIDSQQGQGQPGNDYGGMPDKVDLNLKAGDKLSQNLEWKAEINEEIVTPRITKVISGSAQEKQGVKEGMYIQRVGGLDISMLKESIISDMLKQPSLKLRIHS